MTLVENVISSTILGLTLVAMLALCPRALLAGAHTANRFQAHKLAQAVLEKHRLLPAAQLTPQASTELAAYALDFGGTRLTPQLAVLPVKRLDNQPALLSRELHVRVSWNESGSLREVSHSAVVTEVKR